MSDQQIMTQTQYNTELANFFDRVAINGWGNQSDGDVECLTGHFTLIIVTEAERAEFMDANADEDEMELPVVGNWILSRDSDGNRCLDTFDTEASASHTFKLLQKEFALWDACCPNCENEGPFQRAQYNNLVCSCGIKFDPTEGI